MSAKLRPEMIVGQSRVQEMTYMPLPAMRPKVGFSASTPQNAGGRMPEPPVDSPMAIGSSRPPTAAEEPELEPPGVCARFQGLQLGGCRRRGLACR